MIMLLKMSGTLPYRKLPRGSHPLSHSTVPDWRGLRGQAGLLLQHLPEARERPAQLNRLLRALARRQRLLHHGERAVVLGRWVGERVLDP